MTHKFRASSRYKFSTKEAQDKLLELSKTMNGPELGKVFGCTKDAIYQALKKLKENPPEPDPLLVLKTCPINKGAKICKELGYKHNTDYISQHGLDSFKQNIKPRIKKALA